MRRVETSLSFTLIAAFDEQRPTSSSEANSVIERMMQTGNIGRAANQAFDCPEHHPRLPEWGYGWRFSSELLS